MFYTEHVRIGKEVHIAYFCRWIKRPLWIKRRIEWML